MKSVVLFFACVFAVTAAALADDPLAWPRFRGAEGSGVAGTGKPPAELGADQNLLWKADLPAGVSSPIGAGDRLVLTGVGLPA